MNLAATPEIRRLRRHLPMPIMLRLSHSARQVAEHEAAHVVATTGEPFASLTMGKSARQRTIRRRLACGSCDSTMGRASDTMSTN